MVASSYFFHSQQKVIALLFLLVFVGQNNYYCVSGANDNEAHPHQGKVKPFESGDPKVELDANAISILKSGKPYKTQIQSGASGRGLVVQDVEAPTHVVWDRILDYDNYSKMVPKTVESENYHVEALEDDRQLIYTRMKVGFPMLKLQFYVRHIYEPQLNSLTWTLDYSKKSDFDDSCGYWYVIPHPEHPTTCSRVYYSVEVAMFNWVPKFVVDFMSSKALTDATEWVKKFSELEYSKIKATEEPDEEQEKGEDNQEEAYDNNNANADTKPEEKEPLVSLSLPNNKTTTVSGKLPLRLAIISTILSPLIYRFILEGGGSAVALRWKKMSFIRPTNRQEEKTE